MARKKTESSTESSKEIKARGKFTRANKCMKTTTKKVNESGNFKVIFTKRMTDLYCFLSSYQGFVGIVIGKHNSKREKRKSPSGSPDGAQQVPVLALHSDKEVRRCGKMKLQLFPVDAHTRQGLEKVKKV